MSASTTVSPLGYPVKRGLAQELGAARLDRQDIGLDVSGYVETKNPKCVGKLKGSDAWEKCRGQGKCRLPEDQRTCRREKLPSGHHFFSDCLREQNARMIDYVMTRPGQHALFSTLTFENYKSEKAAYRMAVRWLYRLDQSYRQIVGGANRLKWVIAQEWQKRGVIHFHIIIYGVRLDELSRKRWEHRWSVMGGGYARIYDADKKAAPYLAKYVGKTDDPSNACRWGGSLRGISFPKSTRCCQAH